MRYLFNLLVMSLMLVFGSYAFAQEGVDPQLVSALGFAGPFIMMMAQKYPFILTLFVIMGACRTVLKPLMSLLQAFVLVTPTPKDDEMLAKVMKNKIYIGFSYVLDWALSVKLPQVEKK